MPKSVELKKRKPVVRKRHIPANKKKLAWAVFALLTVIGFILVGKFLSLLASANRPLTSTNPAYLKQYLWDGSSTINVVVKSKSVSVLSFNPADNKLTILRVPDETYLDLPLGYGRYPVRSIYGLGEAENAGQGGRLLEETFRQTAGIAVDGYIVTTGPYQEWSLEEVLAKISHNPLAILNFTRNINSDLTFVEVYKLAWGIKGVRKDNYQTVDLAASSITKSILLPDKTRALSIDSALLDLLVQKNFIDRRLSDESISVGVFNATAHPKLAEGVARLITNMGGRVIFVANSQTPLPQSLVLGKNSYTYQRLGQLFGAACLPASRGIFSFLSPVQKCDISQPEVLDSRSQVTVVLGEDYYRKSARR